MAEGKQAIEYEFEDLRRNTDPLPSGVIAEFDVDEETGAATDADDTDDTGDRDDDGDEEMVPLSEVNKRIARVRKESDRKIEAATGEAGEEIGKLQKRLGDIEQADQIGALEYDHRTKVEQINLEIEKAMEDGDAKAVTRLTGELAEATAAVTVEREKLKHGRADEHDDPDDLHDKDKPPAVIPRAKDWLSEQDWWDDPENAHVKRFVNRLDAKLQEKGYSPHDDDFYEQLEEAVETKYPGIITHTMEDLGLDDDDDEDEDDEFDNIPNKRSASKKKARRAARRQPVGGRDAGGGKRPRNRQRGKTLNRNQIANMKMFGMDPDNKEHVEAYLAEVK